MTFTGKVLLTMRLTALILLCACLQVCAKGYSQITLSETDASLQKVFKEIKKQTGYDFLFSTELLKQAGNVTVKLNNVSLQEAIEECLKGKGLDYEIQEKTIVIKKKISQPLPLDGGSSLIDSPPPIDIHGRVTDSLGKPLAGASVIVKGKGKQKGTQTDANGYFNLSGIADNSTLIISYTGYSTKQYKVDGSNDFAVFLDKSNSPLDEVQVIAYGTTTQRLTTGNISSVKAADIEKQPVNNPLLALEGRVPGLFITQTTGIAGGGVIVRIQGQNSIRNGNDPLYVIDGVPFSSLLAPSGLGLGSILGSSGGLVNGNSDAGNPLSYFNPADIESIDVLKDADATAIYGSRAANGAILITTKKGKVGQTKVAFDMQTGWGKVAHQMEMLSTKRYLQMRHESFRNDSTYDNNNYFPPDPNYDYDLFLWDTTRYTNWQKMLIGGMGRYNNLSMTVTGGNATTQYLVGGTYNHETTVFPGDFADQRESVHFSLTSASVNQRFHFQFSGNYLVDNNRLPVVDLTQNAVLFEPDAPALYNANGSFNWAPNASGTSTFNNPIAQLKHTYINNTNNLVSNAILSYRIFSGLEISSSFGYTNMVTSEFVGIPLISQKPETWPYFVRSAQYGNRILNSKIIEPQATYKTNIGQGKFDMLIGTTILQNNSSGTAFQGNGYRSDDLLQDIQSATSINAVSGSFISTYKYNAVFGRLNYNWLDKYIINLTTRRDGSSRFGPENQFHNFGSIGACWIFSQENFMIKSLPFVSFGKLRGSYGSTGSDQIGDYTYLNLYNPISNGGIPYQGAGSTAPTGLNNAALEWEETRKLSFGLDLGFLKNRLLFNATYGRNLSSNELLSYTLPSITGFASIIKNFPASIQNVNWEFSLNSTNIKNREFGWTSSFNLTIPRNKVIEFPNIAASSYAAGYNGVIVGQPLGIIKALNYEGVDPATGLFKFIDKNGKITSNPGIDDQTAFINTSPRFYGGLQNSISYKGFQFDIFFQFVKQLAAVNYIPYVSNIFPGSFYSGQSNQSTSVLGRWQKPGDNASVERFSTNFYNVSLVKISTAGYQDGSYIRLKNLALSWEIPASWRQSTHLQNCRIYVHGQNLFTITKYKGLDPENQSISSLPPLRVVTVGLQVGL